MAYRVVLDTNVLFSAVGWDRKDDKILECAVEGQATHIVTGDRQHLLPLRQFRGIEIVTPAEMVQLVTETRLQ